MAELKLDPIGYFLVRINRYRNEIEVAFCKCEEIKYSNPKARFGKNTINKQFSSKNTKDIIKWIKDNELISLKEHLKYLEKELKKARKALENGEEYIQD